MWCPARRRRCVLPQSRDESSRAPAGRRPVPGALARVLHIVLLFLGVQGVGQRSVQNFGRRSQLQDDDGLMLAAPFIGAAIPDCLGTAGRRRTSLHCTPGSIRPQRRPCRVHQAAQVRAPGAGALQAGRTAVRGGRAGDLCACTGVAAIPCGQSVGPGGSCRGAGSQPSPPGS